MTTYSEAVEKTITAGEQIHQIVNGTATAEVIVEDGSKVPSIRKALVDNFYFKDPISWQVGQTENVFNQLRQFTDGTWWYAPSATASNLVSMGSTPIGDPLWKIYTIDQQIPVNTLKAELASNIGSTMVGIGGGRTQADKNAEWVSVTDAPYLVKFDNGVTDNTAALNAAFQSGKNILIPDPGEGNFAQVTGTVYYDSKTVIRGPGKYKTVIKASASMPGELDLLAPINETYSAFSYVHNVQMFDLCVDANGFNRAKTAGYVGEWGRAIRVGAIRNCAFVRCNAVGGPQHGIDIACWKDNYIGIGHNGIAVGRPFDVLLSECESTDWVYDDGLTTHGCYRILVDKHTTRITDYAKSMHTYSPTQKGIEIDDGSVGIVITEPSHYGNGTQTMAFSVSTHANNPASYDIQWDSPWAEGCQIAFGAWADTATDVPFDSVGWRCRNVRVRNLVFVKPTYDNVGSIFLSRFLDFQGYVDCDVDGVEVRISADDGTYSAPVSQVNALSAKRINIKGVKVVGVPGIPSGTYTQSRDNGWVRVGVDCADIRIDGFSVDNVGYLNRMVSDTASSALRAAKRIRCGAIPADGQTKTAIFSAATDVEYSDVVVPVGMVPYRIGRTFTAYPAGNYKFNQLTQDTIMGGYEIRSETLADGSQAKPGILFNRQFASASDPTGTLGKGCVAFRTTAASEGRFSITAYHEDVNEFRPIIAVRSTNSVKSLRPVSDNAVACGEASDGRFTVVCAATGTINTSDAREKTAPLSITDAVLDAWGDVQLIAFQWLDAVQKKGEDVARWHFGVIAQQVRDAFLAHGLDGTRYGLLCYDEWEDEYQPVIDVRKNPETGELEEFDTGERIQTRVAGNRWGIRPDQCLFLEAAYQRRRCDRIEERLAAAGI